MVVVGNDRVTWLNGLLTCDLKPLKPGQGAYGLALTKVGRIITDAWVLLGAEQVLVGVDRARSESFRDSLDRFLIMEDCELELRDGYRWIDLHGERSQELAEGLKKALPNAVVLWAPINPSGLGGATLCLSETDAAQVFVWLKDAGAEVVDQHGWDRFRVEHRIPEWGHEFDEKTYPQEATLERMAVSFTKGCYLGQEVVCMLEMRGKLQRRVAVVAAAAESQIEQGTDVVSDSGETVGSITTAKHVGDTRALAMMKASVIAAGKKFRAGECEVEIV